MSLPSGLRALEHRDFRLFWTGQIVSLVGTWMQTVGQSWLVLELTNSPFRLGLVTTLQYAPMLVLSLPAGALTDRVPKRRLILVTQSLFCAQALALGALAARGHVRYWHVAGLAVLFGVATAFDTPARQSFLVEMVDKRDLANAIALNSALFNAARVVGPALAGLLVARYGVAPAFLLNGLSFVAVILALLLMRAEGRPGPARGTTMHQEIAEGIRYAWRTPMVLLILALTVSVSLFVLHHGILVPLLVREVLREGAHTFGLLMASLGVGALSGAVTLAVFGRSRPSLGSLSASAVLVCAATLSVATVHRFWPAAGLLFVIGFSQISLLASCNTLLQITTPDALRGRVMSLYALAFFGVTPFGAFLLGSVAEAFGVPAAYLTGGGLGLAAVLTLLLVGQRRQAAPRPGWGRP